MAKRILYAGDTSLATAGRYLAGVLTHCELGFDYLPSDRPIAPMLAGTGHALYILSDFPVNNFDPASFAAVLQAVHAGAGLVMIGGWESFHGLAGEYHACPLADALPVTMLDRDDRINAFQPCLAVKLTDHPVTGELPFHTPPVVAGYNRVHCKPDATQILAVRHMDTTAAADGTLTIVPGGSAPLLVVGTFGRGRTAAFTSDVAPHWCGGMVDWGDRRITARADGAEHIEVGNHYVDFFARLVRWALGDLG